MNSRGSIHLDGQMQQLFAIALDPNLVITFSLI